MDCCLSSKGWRYGVRMRMRILWNGELHANAKARARTRDPTRRLKNPIHSSQSYRARRSCFTDRVSPMSSWELPTIPTFIENSGIFGDTSKREFWLELVPLLYVVLMPIMVLAAHLLSSACIADMIMSRPWPPPMERDPTKRRGQRIMQRVGLTIKATARINNAANVDMFRSNTKGLQTPKQKIKQQQSLTVQLASAYGQV